jgi:enterochelin esterase-like enzyme
MFNIKTIVMKLKVFSFLSVLLLLLISCEMDSIESTTDLDAAKKSAIVYEEASITSLQIESKSLANNLLGDPSTRNVNVYVPEGYNENPQRHYPVIYLLHGQPASETSLFYKEPFDVLISVAGLPPTIDFPEEGFLPWLNNLMATGGMEKTLIVMVDASTLFGLSHYTNSPTHGDFETFITKELVRFVDQHFRTIPNHKGRALVGQCMGGYGALRLGMKYPSVFSNVAGLTPLEYTVEGIGLISQVMLFEDQLFGYSGPTVPYNAYFPFKFMTSAMYGASAAWLPNPDNPPYYLDLPFSYAQDGTPILNEERMQKFMDQQLINLVPEYEHGLKKLNSIYFDAGLYDELGLAQTNIALHNLMVDLGIDHEFETYEGGHVSHIYSRFALALVHLSKKVTPPYNK